MYLIGLPKLINRGIKDGIRRRELCCVQHKDIPFSNLLRDLMDRALVCNRCREDAYFRSAVNCLNLF